MKKEINAPTPFELFESCLKIDPSLEDYVTDVFATLVELNASSKNLSLNFDSVFKWFEIYSNTKDSVHITNGVSTTVTKEETQKNIYKTNLRTFIPALVIYINMYIKSLRSFQNKIANLKIAKEKLVITKMRYDKILQKKISVSKDRQHPEDVIKVSRSLLEEFEKSPHKDLLAQRNDVEHKVNEINDSILFFVKNQTVVSNTVTELLKIEKMIKQVHESRNMIFDDFIPKMENYLNSKSS